MKRGMLQWMKGLAVAVTLGVLLTGSAFSQAVKRLILTDGSYQTATEWTKAGDRVRYFSAERAEWEELPVALVDWKATEEWNAVRAQKQEEELKPRTEEQIAARKDEELNTPLVAPELRLPAEGGVFLLEQLEGKPALQKVGGSKTQENDHEGINLLKRSVIPIASRVQTIELKGPSAKVRVHSAAPAIFVDVEGRQGVIPGEDFRIVRLERHRDLRMLAKNTVAVTGEQSQTEKFLHTRAEKLSGNWWKLIPLEDLTPGEYAIVVSTPGDDGVVWDFGVDK
jgi:ribosomal protein S8E